VLPGYSDPVVGFEDSREPKREKQRDLQCPRWGDLRKMTQDRVTEEKVAAWELRKERK